jgi:hypothetical protein
MTPNGNARAATADRLPHLIFTAYAMSFPGDEYPGEVEALATMVAQLQCMREALATVGVLMRRKRES